MNVAAQKDKEEEHMSSLTRRAYGEKSRPQKGKIKVNPQTHRLTLTPKQEQKPNESKKGKVTRMPMR